MKHFVFRFFAISSIAFAVLLFGCSENQQTLPTVETSQIESIEPTTAQGGGVVTDNGGLPVTQRGVCWSTSENPTTDQNEGLTIDSLGMGEFTSQLFNLLPNTKYYVRAYAQNSIGTAYGDTVSFITLPAPPLAPDNHHMLLGNPSSASPDEVNENDFLMEKKQYHLSYNNSTRTANWVSWHLNTSYLGSTPRQDDFRADYTLPSQWYRVDDRAYSGSGFDRGHICPSADRTLTITDNSATFLMTNMMPQAPNNNRITWAQLESYCRSLVVSGKELFIVAGPHGQGGEGSNGYAETVNQGNVVVPSNTWKIILVLDNGDNDLARINQNTRTIAIVMPNTQTANTKKWYEYRVSIDEVEQLTGFDFLTNVPDDIQQVIESSVDNTAI